MSELDQQKSHFVEEIERSIKDVCDLKERVLEDAHKVRVDESEFIESTESFFKNLDQYLDGIKTAKDYHTLQIVYSDIQQLCRTIAITLNNKLAVYHYLKEHLENEK